MTARAGKTRQARGVRLRTEPNQTLRLSRLMVLLLLGAAFIPAMRAQVSPTSFCRAVLAKDTVTLSGNMLIDSFNSLDPNQSTNGHYDPAKRGDAGDVASAGAGVRVITDSGNTDVYGHLYTSPSGSVTISGSASVGSIAWVDGGMRGIQPGWYSNNLQVTVSDVTLPGITFVNLRQTSGVVNGTNYNWVLTTGNYRGSSLSLSGSMCINGNVVLYFQNALSISGQGFIYIAPGASLTVYLGGQSTLSGQGVINGTGVARNCAFLGLPTCTSLQNTGGSEFIGTFYAPEAAVTLSGGGAQIVNFAGSVVANTVTISGGFDFHYDQGLCSGCLAPVIFVPPANQTVCQGGTALFTVNAGGTGLAFQWYKNISLLSGQTNTSLTLTNVQSADAGTYTVVVRGQCGAPQTNSASLTVNSPVLVVTAPVNQSVCAGDTAQFNINATGAALVYQWYKNGTLLNQTGATLTLTNVQATDAGTYTVIVSGACGSAQTNSASLVVNSPVLVVTPPANQSVCPGDSVQFSITATGTSLSYQWYKNTSLLAGQTASMLALTNVQAADAATYSVVVSGMCGIAQTNSAVLMVGSPALVVTPPANQSVCPGDTARFTINATGTALVYQWYRNTTVLAGQTGSSLTLTNVQAADAATYTVVVSGRCGLAQTNSATLVVNNPVLVTTPPANQSVCPGDIAQFNVTATGTALAYQWYKNSTLLAAQTVSSLTISNVQASDAAIYTVVVSGMCGLAQTNSASLVVNSPVLVVTPPADQSVCPGDTAQFNVNATGTSLVYQWYKNTNLLTGQTGSSLSLTNVQAADAATYTVVVSGTCGLAQTNSAILVVGSSVLVVTSPNNQSVCPGDTAQFHIDATGTALGYQWYKNGTLLNGQTGSSLTLTNVQATDAGTYSVVVSGRCGLPQTNSASLVVNSPVLVVTPPGNQSVCPGDTAQFHINATGTALAYQWYKEATLLSGQTASSLVLSNVQAGDAATYTVVVSGMCGAAQTNSATLVVNSPVQVITGPANQGVCPGDTAQFTVNAIGTALSYEWFKNGTLLPGQTTNSLVLTNVQAADAALYTVVVSGTCGLAQTNNATLTVNSPVMVVRGPANQSVCPGDTAQFNVNATGTALTYQWYKNAALLNGQITNSLILTNVQAADAATYTVVVSGTCGPAQTNNATLTVNSPVLVVTPPNDQSVCPGDTAQFSVSATGTGLEYQWYASTNLLVTQTNATLTLSHVQTADAGLYTVIVSGTCGLAQTNSANLLVGGPILVVTPPSDQSVCPGDMAHFSITANGGGLVYQWYKGSNLLAGATSSSLMLTNVQAGDAAIYVVVVSGSCSAAQTNTANLVVNVPVQVVGGPGNQIVCPGDTASFTVNANGTDLLYQWFKDTVPLPGQTGSTLVVTNAQAVNAGTYAVVVSGMCGLAQTNSAMLAVNAATTATPLTGDTRNLGDSFTFSTVASGTGPFTYSWTRNGSPIVGATSSSLTLSNLTYNDAGLYAVQVSGRCNTAVQSATLNVNHPPTVTIISPTNGAVFIAPANFTVLADAQDIDGVVTNVVFYLSGTNRLGNSTNAPYFVEQTNLPAGTYTYTAKAWDNLGASGISAPVTVTVQPHAPLSIISAMQFDPQTGLFEQTVRVFNPTYSTFDAVRIYVGNLTNNAVLWNASGTTNGVAYVESHAGVSPGGYVDFVLEYYVPSRIAPNPTLTPVLVPPAEGGGVSVAGFQQHINRELMLPNKTFLIEFSTLTNRLYYIEYTSDLRLWNTAIPAVRGNGTKIQWIDNGQPKTISAPAVTPERFYRVILLP